MVVPIEFVKQVPIGQTVKDNVTGKVCIRHQNFLTNISMFSLDDAVDG